MRDLGRRVFGELLDNLGGRTRSGKVFKVERGDGRELLIPGGRGERFARDVGYGHERETGNVAKERGCAGASGGGRRVLTSRELAAEGGCVGGAPGRDGKERARTLESPDVQGALGAPSPPHVPAACHPRPRHSHVSRRALAPFAPRLP